MMEVMAIDDDDDEGGGVVVVMNALIYLNNEIKYKIEMVGPNAANARDRGNVINVRIIITEKRWFKIED